MGVASEGRDKHNYHMKYRLDRRAFNSFNAGVLMVATSDPTLPISFLLYTPPSAPRPSLPTHYVQHSTVCRSCLMNEETFMRFMVSPLCGLKREHGFYKLK